MTRTERASHPRAIVKDRSESKSGYDKHVQKNGAGAHGWGSLADEVNHEMGEEVLDDFDADSDAEPTSPAAPSPTAARKNSKDGATEPVPTLARRDSEQERQDALKLRAKGVKNGEVDLGSIARSSAAVSQSPPKAAFQPPVSDAPKTATLGSQQE